MTELPDLEHSLVTLLKAQREQGLHPGAQLYVSLQGKPVVDTVVGESVPGRPLQPDDVMLWYSSGKPVTTVAVLQCWERGDLGLDDPVGRFIPGWAGGKEGVTIRHVLTHTGGFTMVGRNEPFDADISYAEAVARIAAHPLEWEPGTEAGYHPSSGWKILGAVVERVDGRPIDRYLADEVLGPAGMTDTYLGIDLATQRSLGDRLVPVQWTGHAFPVPTPDGGIRMRSYHVEEVHNQAWHIAKVEPGGGCRGPASALGRFYEALLGFGSTQILERRTVELLGTVHRHDVPDRFFGAMRTPWGLGVQVAGGLSGGVGRRAFGHNGMASSRGLCDPDLGLVAVLVCNGLPDPLKNEQRMVSFFDAVYSGLGEDAAPFRRPG